MAGTTFRVAASVATLCLVLVLAAGEARAQSIDSSSDGGNPAPEPAAPADATSGPSAEPAASDSADGAPAAAPEGTMPLNAPPEPAAVQEVVVDAAPSPSDTPTTSPEGPPAPSPAPDAGVTEASAQRIEEKPLAASHSLDDQASAVAASTGNGDSLTGPALDPGAPSISPPSAVKPDALDDVGPPTLGDPHGDGLEQLISDVRRDLRSVRGQIDDLQRRLDDGAPPPQNRLIDLRASLGQIAPLLVALEMRLDAAGRLSPHLQNLLRRVRSELRGARVTAAGLVAALRSSGARSAEVRLLLRELERFRAVASMLAVNPFVARAPAPPVSSASAAYMSVQSPGWPIRRNLRRRRRSKPMTVARRPDRATDSAAGSLHHGRPHPAPPPRVRAEHSSSLVWPRWRSC